MQALSGLYCSECTPVPNNVTPSSGNSWKHEELERVRVELLSVCEGRHTRDKIDISKNAGDISYIRENYISRRELEDYQELVKVKYDRISKMVDGVVWTLVIAMVGAFMSIKFPAILGR